MRAGRRGPGQVQIPMAIGQRAGPFLELPLATKLMHAQREFRKLSRHLRPISSCPALQGWMPSRCHRREYSESKARAALAAQSDIPSTVSHIANTPPIEGLPQESLETTSMAVPSEDAYAGRRG